jgi:hypothetical protein
MAYYRLYFFGRSGRIEHFREFDVEHDLIAIQQAGQWRKDKQMELWSRERLVKRWDQRNASTGTQ